MRGPLDRALLYLRTIASLEPRQLAYLPLRRLQRRIAVPVRHRPIELSRHVEELASAVAAFGPRDDEYRARADRVLAGRFSFLGKELELTEIDWNKRYVGHLWSYNLHYFDYALDLAWASRSTGDARYAARFAELARHWISATSSGRGDGWEAYPTATRVVNWIYAVLLLRGTLNRADESAILESAHAQLRALERRIEWHLLANHLQRNLQALAVGGLVFAGTDAIRWRSRWLPLLWKEVVRQVLPDGGHFERSPMYHSIAMADFLETAALAAAAREQVPVETSNRLRAMLPALRVMSRPDGRLHLFNDSAHGIAPPAEYLARLAGEGEDQPKSAALSLPATGYFRHSRDDIHLLIDCGEPGPSYQPGHAHCDLLSFELDVRGEPLVVDSGISGYDGDPLREYARSTRAHNTIAVDGKEQSEVWGTFRMARRAKVDGAAQNDDGARYEFRGSYRPYHSRHVVHSREFTHRDTTLTVTDRVAGGEGRRIESFLHFAPNVSVELEPGRAIASVGGVRVDIAFFGFDSLELAKGRTEPAQGWHCPEFGRAIPAACIIATIRASSGASFGYTLRPVG